MHGGKGEFGNINLIWEIRSVSRFIEIKPPYL